MDSHKKPQAEPADPDQVQCEVELIDELCYLGVSMSEAVIEQAVTHGKSPVNFHENGFLEAMRPDPDAAFPMQDEL